MPPPNPHPPTHQIDDADSPFATELKMLRDERRNLQRER